MRNDRKQTILFIIILLILSMGIGYAFLTTTLTIDGVSDIDSAVWDIHWENVQVQSGSVTGEQVIAPATIGNNGTSVSYHVNLKKPGDYYAFTIDVVNSGTLDAVIDDISIVVNNSNSELPSYLVGTLRYYDIYKDVSVGDYLRSGSSYKYYFCIGYNRYISEQDLPAENESLSISVNITYVQTKMPFYNNTYVYSADYSYTSIGNPLNDLGVYYDNYQDALNAFGHHTFLRHYMVNNLVSTTEVGFEINGKIFYVQGGTGGSSYLSNNSVAQDAANECNSILGLCDNFYLSLSENDEVYFSDNYNYRCQVWNDGRSNCWFFPGA